MTKPDAPPIYTPETPDALRDGLFRGYWAHLKPTQGKAE
jgi:hypothetical protein